MGYKSNSIKNVVDQINRTFFIPDIQRYYVWLKNPKEKKIEKLFDSLLRGYPIGSFLFWELDSNFINNHEYQLYKFIENYDVRHPNNEKFSNSQLTQSITNVVIDGQQRLTSLYIGLRGSRTLKRKYAKYNDSSSYETTSLYLNLNHKPDFEDPEDCYEFEFLTTEEANENKDDKIWFKVNDVLFIDSPEDGDKEDIVYDYINKNNYNLAQGRIVKKLWDVVNDERIISYFNFGKDEKNLDKILQIFVRVNSGGTPLKYSDILMSLLTGSFDRDIRMEIEDIVDDFKNDGFDCYNKDHLLKTCMMLSDCSHVFKISNFNKINLRKVEDKWGDIKKYLTKTRGILYEMGYGNYLSSGYIITTICFYLFKKSIDKLSEQDKEAIKKFVCIAQIRGYFSNSLDNKLSTIKEKISKNDDFKSFENELEKDPDFSMNADFLKWIVNNLKYDRTIFPILQLLYIEFDYRNKKFDIDHIYPKSKFKKSNKNLPTGYDIAKKNELWNLQLLPAGDNKEKLGKDPEEWLKKKYKTTEERERYLEESYIPKNFVLEWSEIQNFEEKRKELILKKLEDIFLK